ncbi:major facilitator superfamily domain-containing protein [Hyaloraphidium curvatum]|nr:major facilitator superfamily domain-containing protein [Hyaloraphidium curvatum]
MDNAKAAIMAGVAQPEEAMGGSRVKLNPFQLMLLALPWVGVQSIWQVEFGIISQVLQAYGLSGALASMVWIFGPIAGFIMAPIIGSLSDRSESKYGRRRPYILGGLAAIIITTVVFMFSYLYGGAALAVGFVSEVLLDFSINILQTPLRAIGSDMTPDTQQGIIQLLAASFQGVGAMIGYGLMSALWDGNPSSMPPLLSAMLAINILFTGVHVFMVHENQHQRDPEDKLSGPFAPFLNAMKNIVRMDRKLATVCAVQFFSWAALFTWWPVGSTWFALIVYDGCIVGTEGCPAGSQGAENAAAGNQQYGYTGMVATAVQIIYSLILAGGVSYGYLRRVKFVYSISLAVGALIMILSKFITAPGYAWAVAVGVSIPISCINSFPFAIVGRYNAEGGGMDVGTQFGIMNLFITTPQLIITFGITGLRASLGDYVGIPWALFMAGCCFAVAAVLALFIVELPDVDLVSSKPSAEGDQLKTAQRTATLTNYYGPAPVVATENTAASTWEASKVATLERKQRTATLASGMPMPSQEALKASEAPALAVAQSEVTPVKVDTIPAQTVAADVVTEVAEK